MTKHQLTKAAKTELTRRSLKATDKRRNAWRQAAINAGVFQLGKRDLKALVG